MAGSSLWVAPTAIENDTSAELYDPTTGTWSVTGSMLKPHAGPATLLLDGRVLVGDIDDPGADNPAEGSELYDPATGTWSATGTMVWGGFATATLLRDGNVLVRSDGGSELFDPDNGTWTATRSKAAQRHSHAAILLTDGRVLVAGGHVSGDTATDSAELYDPDTESWTAVASMHAKRDVIEAVLQSDGKVLVIGSSRSTPQSAESYDPATGAWTATGDLATPGASYGSITTLADGTVLMTGKVGSGPDHPAAELYDPSTGSWTTTGTMFLPHDRAPATLLLDGTVLLAGGGTAGDSAELYVPAGVTPPAGLQAGPAPTDPRLTGAWVATGSMKTPRVGHTAVRLLDGRVLVAGGSNEAEEHMTSAELYDPKSGTWSATADMLKPYFRDGFPATLLLDGRVLVGDDEDPDADDRNIGAEVYDPASGTWTATGAMISRKDFDCCGTATLLRDGRVLVTGREGAQLLDPATMTWTATGKPITRGLGSGVAVLLPDGKVLVAGGGIYPQMLRSAELYDPGTGSWTATGDMKVAHDGPDTATLLHDGTVLVTGRSTSASSSRSAELYDPASGTWTVTGDMISFDSAFRSATLQLDGTVLMVGPGSGPELYDPGTRSWSPFWTMLRAHDEAPATVLLDGRVLVAGGAGCSAETGECGITGSAVLYDPGATSTAAPPPRLIPAPTPTPSPVPSQADAGQPGGRPWTVTVSNNSPRSAKLFVAEENEQGLMGRHRWISDPECRAIGHHRRGYLPSVRGGGDGLVDLREPGNGQRRHARRDRGAPNVRDPRQ